jgi:hypothetical protein
MIFRRENFQKKHSSTAALKEVIRDFQRWAPDSPTTPHQSLLFKTLYSRYKSALGDYLHYD